MGKGLLDEFRALEVVSQALFQRPDVMWLHDSTNDSAKRVAVSSLEAEPRVGPVPVPRRP